MNVLNVGNVISGIHVVPCDNDGRLVVQGIEPGGRIDRQGNLAVGDEIVAINGTSLTSRCVLFLRLCCSIFAKSSVRD